MSINKSTRYVAYICPFCSGVNEQSISMFALSGASPLELSCTDELCGEDCVTISNLNGKYKIIVECPACGNTHTFTVSAQSFLSRSLLSLNCPESGISVFFSGERAKVRAALDENNRLINDMSEQFDFFTEELNLFYKVVERIHDLLEHNKISCSCGSDNIAIDIRDGCIALVCKGCGVAQYIQSTESELMKLINSESLIIK